MRVVAAGTPRICLGEGDGGHDVARIVRSEGGRGMPELRAGLWSINANGFEGPLRLTIGGAGNIVDGCTVFGDTIAGFFNRGQGTIIFVRQSPPGARPTCRYTGATWGQAPPPCAGSSRPFRAPAGVPISLTSSGKRSTGA